jgi:hypothetical protein
MRQRPQWLGDARTSGAINQPVAVSDEASDAIGLNLRWWLKRDFSSVRSAARIPAASSLPDEPILPITEIGALPPITTSPADGRSPSVQCLALRLHGRPGLPPRSGSAAARSWARGRERH